MVLSPAVNGDGGVGRVTTIIPHADASSASIGQVSSSTLYFAGGGGGSGYSGFARSAGGLGGGGSGATAATDNAAAGTANSGGGGGGISYPVGHLSKAGGSGVVIVKYKFQN